MRNFILFNLLRLHKTYKNVLSITRCLAPKAIEMTLVSDNKDKNDIEKILLLSAFMLDFQPNKDMRSDFICEYIHEIFLYIIQRCSTEDLIYLFESSCCGVSFMNTNERQNTAEKSLQEYITIRLILYRKIAIEYSKGNTKHINSLFYVITHWSFDVFRYIKEVDIDFLEEDMIMSSSCINQYQHKCFLDLVSYLHKFYYNKVSFSKISKFSNTPFDERWHTEGILPFLHLRPDVKYLTFEKITGYGDIICQDCGNKIVNVVAFCHSAYEADLGRQCPQCGTFCSEKNISKEYHCFSPSEQDFICPQCGFIIRRKKESIFKGNANPLFCPKCESTNIVFKTSYLT